MQFRRYLNQFLGRDAAPAQPKLMVRDPAITLISIIYTTAPKTFTGDAVYVTVTGTPTDDGEDATPTSTSKATGSVKISGSSSASKSTTSSITSSASSSSSLSSSSVNTATKAAASASKAPLATAAPSTGMSGGAKAGLAFGLIILFALIGAGILFALKKRKKDASQQERIDDEKAFFAAGRDPDALPSHTTANTSRSLLTDGGFSGASYNEKPVPPPPAQASNEDFDRSSARFSYEVIPAPRLSLRGVSQFGPMGSLSNDEVRVSGMSGASSQVLPPAGAAALAAASGISGAAAVAATRNRSDTAISNDPNNPFGNHAEKVVPSTPQQVPLPLSPTVDAARKSLGPQAADFPLPDSTPGSPGASKPLSLASNKSEIGADAAVAAGSGAAAIAAATAAAASNTPQGGAVSDNVFRVQLDFKPSMEDELDIVAGQLVRCLHEYDDGWVSTTFTENGVH
jgi:hypothetical protein